MAGRGAIFSKIYRFLQGALAGSLVAAGETAKNLGFYGVAAVGFPPVASWAPATSVANSCGFIGFWAGFSINCVGNRRKTPKPAVIYRGFAGSAPKACL